MMLTTPCISAVNQQILKEKKMSNYKLALDNPLFDILYKIISGFIEVIISFIKNTIESFYTLCILTGSYILSLGKILGSLPAKIIGSIMLIIGTVIPIIKELIKH